MMLEVRVGPFPRPCTHCLHALLTSSKYFLGTMHSTNTKVVSQLVVVVERQLH